MLAIDMDQPEALAPGMRHQALRRHRAAIALHRDPPLRPDPVLQAVRLKAVLHLGIRPGEDVDAERDLARLQRMGQGNEEAPLETADLGDRAGDPLLRLQPQQPGANRGGKARGHADDAIIAAVEIGLNRRMAGRGKMGHAQALAWRRMRDISAGRI